MINIIVQRMGEKVPDSGASNVGSRLTEEWNTNRNSKKGWPHFLEALQIAGLRGWNGELVEFRFPVVAIAGENGSGKSTVLKAAASAYKSTAASTKTFYPDDFFPNTLWETVSAVSIISKYRLEDETKTNSLRKPTRRWRGMGERPERPVFFLDISRTQPIDTVIGYGKIAKAAAIRGEVTELDEDSRNLLGRVMGKTYDKSAIATHDNKTVGILEWDGKTYSNFHQGAGEEATTDLVSMLSDVPRNSLVLIDEIESSLHPRAQRRLMTELLYLSRKKRLQFVLTTHSQYVLEQLPTEARVYIQNQRIGERSILYGVTPQFALSLMDDTTHPELVLYVEDERAEHLLDRLISTHFPGNRNRVSINTVGPASTVRSLGILAADGKFDKDSLGILDGDQEPSKGCLSLPGGHSPERTVFDGLTSDNWEEVARRLGVRPGDLLDSVEDAKRLDEEHAWPRRTAENLGPRIRAKRVWEDAAAVWVENSAEEKEHKEFATNLGDYLPGS